METISPLVLETLQYVPFKLLVNIIKPLLDRVIQMHAHEVRSLINPTEHDYWMVLEISKMGTRINYNCPIDVKSGFFFYKRDYIKGIFATTKYQQLSDFTWAEVTE